MDAPHGITRFELPLKAGRFRSFAEVRFRPEAAIYEPS